MNLKKSEKYQMALMVSRAAIAKQRIDIVNTNKRSLLSSCYTIYSTTMTWAKQLRKLSIKCSYFGFSLERETLSNSFLTPPMTPTGLFCLTFSFVAGCLELCDMNC